MLLPKMEKTANAVVWIMKTSKDTIKHQKTMDLQYTSNIAVMQYDSELKPKQQLIN